jgi:hypothetical protein
MASAKDDRKSGKTGKSGGREQRLAAALRENLRRRKAQARGRDQAPDSTASAVRARENGDPGPADH